MMSFNLRTLSDNECRISVFAMKTQITNSFISGASEINKLSFFGFLRHFFRERMDAHFFGRALSRSHMAFFRPFNYVLDAFLKKRMAPSIWKSYVRC